MPIPPGISEQLYIGGVNLSYGPKLTVKTNYARQDQRLKSTRLQTELLRLVLTDPDLTCKYQLALPWEDLTSDDVRALTLIVGTAQEVDVCPWIPRVETWTFPTTGAAFAGTLLRRDAPSTLAAGVLPTAVADYAMVADLNGSIATMDGTAKTITLGATADYRTSWTTTSTASAGDVIRILYWPVFRMRIVSEQVSFPGANRQGWALVAEEV